VDNLHVEKKKIVIVEMMWMACMGGDVDDLHENIEMLVADVDSMKSSNCT
jgi:hypothetical protein